MGRGCDCCLDEADVECRLLTGASPESKEPMLVARHRAARDMTITAGSTTSVCHQLESVTAAMNT
eukprot:5219954-Amphidinium_carterae.1